VLMMTQQDGSQLGTQAGTQVCCNTFVYTVLSFAGTVRAAMCCQCAVSMPGTCSM
jgi:hypothetical protein